MSGLAPWIARGAALAIGIGLVVGALWFAWAAGAVLVLVFVAVILGAGLSPIVAWLRSTLHIGRGAAILLVYGVFLASVIALALVVLPVAIEQFGAVVAALPRFFDDARAWAASLEPAALSRTVTSVINVAERAAPSAQEAPAGEEVLEAGITIAGAVMSIATLLTVVYFWLTEHARLQRYALAFVPRHRRPRARDVWNQAEARLGRWVRAQLILMATIGIGTGVAYTLLGLPAAVLLALLAALAEAIPIVGPLLGAIPAVLVAVTVSPEMAVVVAGIYFVLQLVEGHILVPIVMRNTVGISPFLVILSVLAGAAAGGFVGALLAVPIAATAEILLEGLQAREVPVAQDPSAAPDPDELERDAAGVGASAAGTDRPFEPSPGAPTQRRVAD